MYKNLPDRLEKVILKIITKPLNQLSFFDKIKLLFS